MLPKDLDDKSRQEPDSNSFKDELGEDILNGDADETLERADEAGIDINDLNL